MKTIIRFFEKITFWFYLIEFVSKHIDYIQTCDHHSESTRIYKNVLLTPFLQVFSGTGQLYWTLYVLWTATSKDKNIAEKLLVIYVSLHTSCRGYVPDRPVDFSCPSLASMSTASTFLVWLLKSAVNGGTQATVRYSQSTRSRDKVSAPPQGCVWLYCYWKKADWASHPKSTLQVHTSRTVRSCKCKSKIPSSRGILWTTPRR